MHMQIRICMCIYIYKQICVQTQLLFRLFEGVGEVDGAPIDAVEDGGSIDVDKDHDNCDIALCKGSGGLQCGGWKKA